MPFSSIIDLGRAGVVTGKNSPPTVVALILREDLMGINKPSGAQPGAVSPAESIDQAITRAAVARKASDTRHLASTVNQLTAGILSFLSIPKREWPSETRDGLFSPSLSFAQNCFSSACLLRLLGYNPDAFQITPFRFQAYQLFDRTLEHDLYKRLKLDAKMQNHEKEEKLKDVVPHIEQALESAVTPPLGLEMAPVFRSALLKIVRNAYGHAVLQCYRWRRQGRSLSSYVSSPVFSSRRELWSTSWAAKA